LEWEKSVFPKHSESFIALEPFKKLCDTSVQFLDIYAVWMNGPFIDLNANSVTETFDILWKDVFKLGKLFAELPISRKVCETIKNRLEKFKGYLPIVSALRNEGLKDRHWEEINLLVGKDITPSSTTTLTVLLEAEILQHIPKIELVSEIASKQWGFQKNLVKMREDYSDVALNCIDYKDTGTKILASVDEIQSLLDDHIIKTQTIRGSPFVKAFESDVLSWEMTLNLIQEILDELLKVQSTWLYLEPIFSSEDIMTQMPVEGKKFKNVDKYWRDIIKSISETTTVLDTINIPRIIERLKESNLLLDEIQKGLNDYLEKKRLFFPRFFFLSNDELLEILAGKYLNFLLVIIFRDKGSEKSTTAFEKVF
jgi:dynein heavy chain